MTTSDTKHLKLRGDVWWYQRRIPKALLDQFDNQTTLSESLGTGDIREARRKRDILNGKLEERRFHAPNSDRHRFIELVQTMSEDKEKCPESWDEHYHLDQIQGMTTNIESHTPSTSIDDKVFLHAYTTVGGHQDHRSKYRITLKEALHNWSKQRRKPTSEDNVSKAKKSVDQFLKLLKLYDIQLEDITKRQVDQYIEMLLSKHATSTARGYISRLRSIWNYCDQLGEVNTPCPFDNHSFSGGTETNKKQAFTPREINLIKQHIENEEPMSRLLVQLAVFTGCRISELCNLQAKNVVQDDNIVAIFIEKGKTDAATRIVPLTTELGERLIEVADSKDDDELLLGVDGKSMSRWFSRIKTAHISTDTTKSFHSFRKMFATAMQRSGVPELLASPILGHKRGDSMTYGYYSDGYTLPQLKEAYDQCVEHIIW
ncbi:tyrosine-type recombinase/integrase [Vibrio splendidus]